MPRSARSAGYTSPAVTSATDRTIAGATMMISDDESRLASMLVRRGLISVDDHARLHGLEVPIRVTAAESLHVRTSQVPERPFVHVTPALEEKLATTPAPLPRARFRRR